MRPRAEIQRRIGIDDRLTVGSDPSVSRLPTPTVVPRSAPARRTERVGDGELVLGGIQHVRAPLAPGTMSPSAPKQHAVLWLSYVNAWSALAVRTYSEYRR